MKTHKESFLQKKIFLYGDSKLHAPLNRQTINNDTHPVHRPLQWTSYLHSTDETFLWCSLISPQKQWPYLMNEDCFSCNHVLQQIIQCSSLNKNCHFWSCIPKVINTLSLNCTIYYQTQHHCMTSPLQLSSTSEKMLMADTCGKLIAFFSQLWHQTKQT